MTMSQSPNGELWELDCLFVGWNGLGFFLLNDLALTLSMGLSVLFNSVHVYKRTTLFAARGIMAHTPQS